MSVTRLIDALLEDERVIRVDALARAESSVEDRDVLADYEDDIKNINDAIVLWNKVKP